MRHLAKASLCAKATPLEGFKQGSGALALLSALRQVTARSGTETSAEAVLQSGWREEDVFQQMKEVSAETFMKT